MNAAKKMYEFDEEVGIKVEISKGSIQFINYDFKESIF